MDGSMNMSVSQIFQKEGKRYAYVSFDDGDRKAEGRIPDCRIVASDGFDRGEIVLLEEYMKTELPSLKKMASGVNVMRSFLSGTEK